MNMPLHCLLLQTPGELLEGEKDFLRLGYAVEAFPSRQDASCLDDAEPEELLLHAYAPGWRHGDLPEVPKLGPLPQLPLLLSLEIGGHQ